ncbi:hypothetical protein U1Q18_042533 [Sarracenia purpurea var. burkii]
MACQILFQSCCQTMSMAAVLLAEVLAPLLLMYSTLGLGVLMSIVGMAARVSEILSLCSGFAGCNVVVAFGSWIFLVGCFSLVLLALMVFLFLDGCVAGFGVAYGTGWAASLRVFR